MATLKNIQYCPRCLEKIEQRGLEYLDDYHAICAAYNDNEKIWAYIFDCGDMYETFRWLDSHGYILTADCCANYACVKPNVNKHGFFCCEKGC